ncbi:MAG: Na/Pi cotransporter family protein [Candidatus Limivivens sp.]|nr:Na/Pi cotransporter family protein [Candidatus Limivivens sp.]
MENFKTITGLLGGLAVFIYGMNMMSEGLQKAAGEKMKAILGVLTKNPVMGVLAGALVTSVLQSSSATTVMVIGFVSAGLMQLPQAISVILGANIGTTMTAQIIAFKINDFIWPIVFVGFVVFFFAKSEKAKNIGQTIFAFGLLFVGIITMGNVMKPLASSPVFTDLIAKVSDIPVLGVLLGTVMTLVVQSSSATIAVLQNFAMQPAADGVSSILGLTGAIPILLGDNIGTTITALLASVGQSKDAKRTAVAHSVFNITGSFVFLWIIPWFARFVQWISPKGDEVDVISRQIANAHTTFNVVNTLIWLPLIWLMVKIVMFLVPGDEKKKAAAGELQYIDPGLTSQPAVSLHLTRKEVMRVTEMVRELTGDARNAFLGRDKAMLTRVETEVSAIQNIQEQAVKYVASLMAAGIYTEAQVRRAAAYMATLDELERVAKAGLEIANVARVRQEKGYKFSKEAVGEIEESLEGISGMLLQCRDALKTGDAGIAQEVMKKKKDIQELEVHMMQNHVERLKKQKCRPEFSVLFSSVLNSLERMGNCSLNVAEVLSEELRSDEIVDIEKEEVQVQGDAVLE